MLTFYGAHGCIGENIVGSSGLRIIKREREVWCDAERREKIVL